MKTILLIRHGETEWNREGRVQGASESVLSPLGIEQARRLEGRLASESIQLAISSSAGRAVDTCRIALGDRMVAKTTDALREMNLGAWEGRPANEIKREQPGMIELWQKTPSKLKIPGAESLRAFRQRVVREMNRIRELPNSETVVIFTHGGVICIYLTCILGMKLDDIWRFKIRNGSVTKIIYPPGNPRLDLLNDISHLDGAVSTALPPTLRPSP